MVLFFEKRLKLVPIIVMTSDAYRISGIITSAAAFSTNRRRAAEVLTLVEYEYRYSQDDEDF